MNSKMPIDPLSSAIGHAELGLPVSGTSLPKRVVERLTRFFVEPQRAYNRGVIDAIRILRADDQQLAHRITVQGEDNDRAAARVRSDFTGLQVELSRGRTEAALTHGQVVELARTVQRLESRMAALDAGLGDLRSEQATRRQRDRSQQSLVALFLREVRRQHPSAPDPAAWRGLPDPDDELDLALEDAFAGSFDDVQARRSGYLSDVEPVSGKGRLLDIRPGRGEWLELLSRARIPAYGVDTNRAAVAACHERGLDVVHADALEHLASVPDGTLAAITGFHVADRLGFRSMVELVDHGIRALRPGGVLLLESPNPTNLLVGASGSRMHPASNRPLHPEVLEFIVSSRGFADVELRYLHPDPVPLEWSPDSHDLTVKPLQPVVERLNDLLFGPRDFALIGRRVED